MPEELTKEEIIEKGKFIVKLVKELYPEHICGVDASGVHLTDRTFRRLFDLSKCAVGTNGSKYLSASTEIDGVSFYALF